MALGFQDSGMELDGWLELIRAIIRQYSFALDSLQITGEANLTFYGRLQTERPKRFGAGNYCSKRGGGSG